MFARKSSATRRLAAGVASGALILAFAGSAMAQDTPGGEAGPLHLRDLGYRMVGIEVTGPDEEGNLTVSNQMYVEYALPLDREYDNPVVMIHGGGGQSVDWIGTPDERDGWRDYFVVAGFDTYMVDRPGYGRSPASPNYGNGQLATPPAAFIARLATSDNWPGGEATVENEAVQRWLAGSPTTPYAGNVIAAKDIGILLGQLDTPAILFPHSAGGPSALIAADANPGEVAGILAFEIGGANPITSEELRANLNFEPALAEGFEAVDMDGCMMQPEGSVSTLPNLADVKIVLFGSEHNSSPEELACQKSVWEQAGVQSVETVYLPDEGFAGSGHFAMAETNSGEVVQVFLREAEKIANNE